MPPSSPAVEFQWRTQKALLLTGRTCGSDHGPPSVCRLVSRGSPRPCSWALPSSPPLGRACQVTVRDPAERVSFSVLKSPLPIRHCVCVPRRLCASARGAQPPSGSERAGLLTPMSGLAGGGRLPLQDSFSKPLGSTGLCLQVTSLVRALPSADSDVDFMPP